MKGVIFVNGYFLKTADIDGTPKCRIMIRPQIKNRIFDRMGEGYKHLIDPYHFLGRSPFDIPVKTEERPPAVLRRNGELYELQLAIPGFKKDEIHISVDNGVLLVKGERKEKRGETDDELVWEEFNYSYFEREFKMAETIAQEKIEARLEDGILYLRFIDVPKDEEKRFRSIAIE